MPVFSVNLLVLFQHIHIISKFFITSEDTFKNYLHREITNFTMWLILWTTNTVVLLIDQALGEIFSSFLETQQLFF